MKISRSELLNALEMVKSGLANTEIIEQSTSFAFLGDRVVTYNDEISVSHPVEGLDVQGAVEAKTLYQFLGKIKKEEIEVEWEENEVKISTGKARAGLTFHQEVVLPIEEVGNIDEWHNIPKNLINVLKFCHPCCSRDLDRPALTCIHIRDAGLVEASDTYQVIRHIIMEELPFDSLLIPVTSIAELVKYKVTHLATGQGWVHFKTEEGTVFSCRTFDGEYPNIDPILNIEDSIEIHLPKTMIPALERAKVFTQPELTISPLESIVTIAIGEGRAKISAKSISGWFEEEVKTKYKGELIQFRTHADFLMEVLEKAQECIFGENKLKFTGEGWEHIVATMAGG